MPVTNDFVADSHLGPIVLIPIVELEPEEACRNELHRAAPELGLHICISIKAPPLPFAMQSNNSGMVHNLQGSKLPLSFHPRALPCCARTRKAEALMTPCQAYCLCTDI